MSATNDEGCSPCVPLALETLMTKTRTRTSGKEAG
jgi:hypothetical protein